jgi:hypothetical protein
MAVIETMTFPAGGKYDRQFVLLQDVVIPAGTVLKRAPNERGGDDAVECVVEMGKDSTAYLNMQVAAIADAPADLIAEHAPE